MTKLPTMVNQAYINGIRVDVVSPSEYMYNRDLYYPKTTCVAIDGQGYVLPVRTTNVDYRVPGYYMSEGYGPGGSPFIPVVKPTASQMATYSKDNIVDYANVSNMREFLMANAEIAEQERRVFLSDQPDDIVKLSIDEMYDSPLMILCKRIINSKNVSSKLLENRMGANYNNNMRLLKNKHDISYNKAAEVLSCIDVRITATAENTSDNIISPMPSPISCELI